MNERVSFFRFAAADDEPVRRPAAQQRRGVAARSSSPRLHPVAG
jgi:hypothetical protein